MTEQNPPVKIGNVLHPVNDVPAAITFYRQAFGLDLAFADGERYAALDAGGVTLALVAPEEDITEGAPAASFKVPEVAAALTAITEAGGSVLRPAEQGQHEVHAVARDPWGNQIVVYGPR